ncbi:DUF1217 domain-containing protein [Jannaschia sp. M317]|uniref:DUF1217 domain-containing protein n=1 Tax=Jannaschia sp. M317 TaxID=2867011 RepID=UPI0021A61C6E|nr:DUF1217 domain-containing protein [Jannaschia sp. M317]UWQ18424.1 DUF1217 domain-containing protein [Jannaschia sp. M317]
MTFQPFIPSGGLAGWRFLQNTLDAQKAAHGASPIVQRDLDYFAANIGKVETAEQLVSDFRLLSVALGAFGLSEDVGSKFLIRRVLEEGTIDPESLANKLSDKRYRDLSRAFGFGDFPVANTALSDFPEKIAARYRDQSFEQALGQTDNTMRLALNARRELATISEGEGSNKTKWFTIMGTPPLRSVFEGALNLPTSFATLDLDRQLKVLQERSLSAFGSDQVVDLAEPKTMEKILDRYTAMAGLRGQSASTVTSPALFLLRGF